MSTNKSGGQKPRPRVALLGEFIERDLEQFRRMFSTIWYGETIYELKEQVDVREIDLLIIGRDIGYAADWPEEVYVISFSEELNYLPGPTPDTSIRMLPRAKTEEFVCPEVSLPLSRCRDADLQDVSSVRGWWLLGIESRSSYGINKTKRERAEQAIYKGAIIFEPYTKKPLATHFLRENRLGVAWLPYQTADQKAWVDVLVTQWAQSDKEHFPNIGDWTASPEWMVPEEESIIARIKTLEIKKNMVISKINRQIGDLNDDLATAKAKANKGRRQLITARSDDLKDEVIKVFKEIGFEVDDIDKLLGEGEQKKEDLRLRDPSENSEYWEAIVEVRGHAKSSGKPPDLQRLVGFSTKYQKEKGGLPDKLIYVVNGQTELLPPQRQQPFAAAEDNVEAFAESNGLVIWTLDLFRAMKATDPKDYSALRKSIKKEVGIWKAVR